MKDNKLFQKIENNDSEIRERKERAKARCLSELGICEEKMKNKKLSKRSIFAIATSCLAVCILIPVLAIILSQPKIEEPTNRFCSQEDYSLVESTKSLKDYSTVQEGLLFLDWEKINSFVYIDKTDNETVLGMRESVINSETGTEIKIDIVFQNIQLEQIETQKIKLDKSIDIFNISVLLKNYREQTIFSFQYKGYTYYLEVNEALDNDGITELVNELLNSETK